MGQTIPDFRGQATSRHGLAKLIVIAGAAILAVGIGAGIVLWSLDGADINPEVRLNTGLRFLKREQPQEAKMMVAAIHLDTLVNPADQAKYHLISGAASLDEAEKAEHRRIALKKSRESHEHLEKASKIGFPRGYEGLGKFLYGKVLHVLFRWDEAKEPLDRSVAEWPNGRIDALARLIDMELSQATPNTVELVQRLDQWDSLAGLTDDERVLGKIKRIEVAIATGNPEHGIELVSLVPEDSRYRSQAQYLLALSHFRELKAIPENEREAPLERLLGELDQVVRSPEIDEQIRRRAQYYRGLVELELGRPKIALTTYVNLRQKAPHTIEGLVATIEEMQALLDLERYNDVAQTMKYCKELFGELDWYRNTWISFPDMRSRTATIGRAMLDKEAFSETIFFAENLPPFCERIDALRLLAEANHRWALSLKGKPVRRDALPDIRDVLASTEKDDERNLLQQQLYAKAAKAYEELARLELRAMNYREIAWAAIDCAQAAGELAHSNALIQATMAYDPREEHPRSLIKIAENDFAMQLPDKALDTLVRCIQQFPTHLMSYQARLNAARILNENAEFDRASQYLEENLYLHDLSPENAVWRESLFEFGKLHYRQGELLYSESERLKELTSVEHKAKRLEHIEQANGHFLKCIDHLEEWIKRYPKDPRRFDTLYCVGQAYRMASQWPRVLLAEKQLSTDDLRRSRLLEQRKLLEAARNTFKEIRDGINSSQEWTSLDPTQQRLLRNSYFAEADLMFEARQYESALSAYRNIANRLLNEPETLEALVQVAECLKALGRHEESLGVLSQARDVLQQIPPQRDPHFSSLTRFSRAEWSQHLDWMKQNTL